MRIAAASTMGTPTIAAHLQHACTAGAPGTPSSARVRRSRRPSSAAPVAEVDRLLGADDALPSGACTRVSSAARRVASRSPRYTLKIKTGWNDVIMAAGSPVVQQLHARPAVRPQLERARPACGSSVGSFSDAVPRHRELRDPLGRRRPAPNVIGPVRDQLPVVS